MATTRKPRTAKPPAAVNDGFTNFVSRVGTGSDKAYHNTYAMDYRAARQEIDAAYRTSWFRKIVDIIPFDEVREWRTWAGADDTQTTLIDTEEKRLGLRHKIKDARTLARKDGGAAILIATRGTGNLMRPLDPETVGKDGLQYLAVMPRDRIHPREEIRDPESPWYGEPGYYEIAKQDRTQVKIHPSRVIRFVGNPIMSANEWTGWGDSVWIEMRDAVRNVDSVAANTAAMLAEAKIDVIKLKNLAANLSTAEGESRLVTRFAAVNTLKSIVNALILDADDEHDTKTLNFAGLKDINDIMLLMMSGMADIPQTRLFGRSPQGMSATGESDLRNYYDRIRAGQTVELSPLLAPLDEMLIRSALGSRPPEIYYEWAPLYTLSEKEQADIENTFADAAVKLANTGLLADDALSQIVQNRITEAGNWPGAEKAFNEAKLDPDFEGDPTPEEIAAEEARQAEIAQDARPEIFEEVNEDWSAEISEA